MPAVVLPDRDAYKQAFRILMRVGGWFHGRGEDTLIVNEEQYAALVEAGVVSDGTEGSRRGKKAQGASDVGGTAGRPRGGATR